MKVRTVSSVAEIGASCWDALAGEENPFLSYGFLSALEESGSVGAEAGWLPRHLVVEDDAGIIQAVAPAYLKGHSQGEYVFDHGWAQAYEQAGGRYYPKYQIAVPFTPVNGPRLLCADEEMAAVLIRAAIEITAQNNLSSLHATFLNARDARICADAGMMLRYGEQFHWFNRGYGSFDEFLAALSSRKRKNIRKERRRALESGLAIRILRGNEISESDWDAFFAFYLDTGSRKWGRPYLNRRFFSLMAAGLGERVVLMLALRDGRPVAGALNLLGTDALYGRYWGATEHHDFLHFELCYYQAIEFAIAHGLSRVEAGAQGPHKLARGYEPVKTISAHWIADPAFRDAVARFLAAEKEDVAAEIDYLKMFTPFKKR